MSEVDPAYAIIRVDPDAKHDEARFTVSRIVWNEKLADKENAPPPTVERRQRLPVLLAVHARRSPATGLAEVEAPRLREC